MKWLRQRILWLADGIWYAGLLLVVAMAGCVSKPKVIAPPIPTAWLPAARTATMEAADVLPAKLMGCAWDYAVVPGITFEVWASTNLVHWVLATNTVETVALFPVKQMEFYKVRARDEHGLVSDWATVRK